MGDGDRKSSVASTVSGALSQQDLVGVSSRAAFYRRRTKKEKRLVVIIAVLLLLLLILIILLAVTSKRYRRLRDANKICSSEECIKTAASFIENMDKTVDPCEDFYKFTCGRWEKAHPMPDFEISHGWFDIARDEITRRIRDALADDSKEIDPDSLAKARTIYKECLDTSAMDKLSLKPMITVMEDLGLPVPSTKRTEIEEDTKFNLTYIMAQAIKLYGIDILLAFDVTASPENTTENVAYIGRSDFRSRLPGYPGIDYMYQDRDIHHRRRSPGPGKTKLPFERLVVESAYMQYVKSVMSHAYLVQHRTLANKENFTNIAEKVISIESKIEEITGRNYTDEDQARIVTFEQLQNTWDAAFSDVEHVKVDWISYFTLVYEGVYTGLEKNDTVYMGMTPSFMNDLSELLKETDVTDLRNYIWWQVAKVISPHTDKTMRTFKERYLTAVYTGYSIPSRAMYCASAVNKLLTDAVSYTFAEPTQFAGIKSKVQSMMMDILQTFKSLVNGLNWMDSDTKKACKDKAETMRISIGFPEYVLDWYSLDENYEELEINGKSFLVDMITVVRLSLRQRLRELMKPNKRTGWGGESTALVVNAFYSPTENAVVIPIGILRFPFYDLGLEVLNYGAIGSILGHELTHGFDSSGRLFDKEGNQVQWWTNATIEEYMERTECFIDQYSGYNVTELNQHVNGRQTLDENIADNGGVREAWRAYQRYRDRHGNEPHLPGLEQFDNDQLFFLAQTNVWCEKWTDKSLASDLGDSHSPNKFRIWGALSNMPEFARAWGCDKGTPMNPHRDRCVIW